MFKSNLTGDASKLLVDLSAKKATYWVSQGEKQVLQLFKQMATKVPAYKKFLKQNKIDSKKIQSVSDLQKIPAISKENYLRENSKADLCWDGKFSENSWVISTTSGSTGEPFYFPRQEFQDRQYALLAELYLRTNFEIHKKSTLYIVAFPMGAWIGGVFTYQALKHIADTGKYQLSIITPGISKQEILKAVKNLGSHFDQIIIGSYGPFLKDIIDDGIREGINWKKYNLGFVFSAEGFSESFRDYVISKTGLKNKYTSTLNHYGVVDLGTLSYETPLSILLRRIAVENKDVYQLLFGQTSKLPTLTQYIPEMFYFEEENGRLYCSARSGLPLMRYDLKDRGGVLGYEETHRKLKELGIDLDQEARKSKIQHTVWKLPFVYVYERADFSVSFYAFQIYPETVRKALIERKFHSKLTSKFTMRVDFDKQGNQKLEVHIELRPGIKPSKSLISQVQKAIVLRLLSENSEYRKTHEELSKKVLPQIKFWPYEHELHFKPGSKQKWVKHN